MRKFLFRIFIFLSPPFFLFFFTEIYISVYPLAFKKQASYLNNNLIFVETLILGSSHNLDALNPDYLNYTIAANHAMGSQDIELDYAILEKYFDDLINLKYLILDVSYHALEHDIPDNFHGNSLYLRYHGINNFGRDLQLKDYSLFLSAPDIYFKFFNPFKKKAIFNNFGIITDETIYDDKVLRFKSLDYNESLVKDHNSNYYINRHKNRNLANFKKNKQYLINIIELCSKAQIKVILLMPPVHKVYYNAMIPEKKILRDQLLDSLVDNYNFVHVWNYEKSELFNIHDFKNDDHLNLKGSKKFSELISYKLFDLQLNEQ